MAKKPAPTTELVKLSNVAKFELNDTALALAARFGLSLTDAKETRVDRAALNMNRSMHCMVAAGLDLASLQADCEHGEFLALITERGFEQSGAYRAIWRDHCLRPPLLPARLTNSGSCKLIRFAARRVRKTWCCATVSKRIKPVI